MALKAKITKEEYTALAEVLQKEYHQQSNGGYALEVPVGLFDKSTVDEFRNNNITLKQKLEEYAAKQKELDGMVAKEDYEAIKAELQNRMDAEKIEKGNIDEVVKDRMSRAQSEFDERLGILTKDLEESKQLYSQLHTKFQQSEINAKLVTELNRVGKIRQGAEKDLLARATNVWRLNKDHKLVAYKPDGTEMFGKNAEPITIKEYCEDQLVEAAHCYESASGSNAFGDGDSSPSKRVESVDLEFNDVADILDEISSGEKLIM